MRYLQIKLDDDAEGKRRAAQTTYFDRVMRATAGEIFQYCSYHEITDRLYPRNGEKGYFATLLIRSGRAQHFLDTRKKKGKRT